jgi:hypothetical protein
MAAAEAQKVIAFHEAFEVIAVIAARLTQIAAVFRVSSHHFLKPTVAS